MHIKSIFVDGFKSYAKRTEISGFDPAFNAITGLNGSGKSNILDAICFLLGITNLSQVRASNLQDLVYKGGQAGITKATVSIIFDNKEKGNSPIGYESFDEITITRQIVIGGKNKYLINGNNATNSRVHDLFRSVQLNVNNPHFLIMQGRITKVLNMKPPEILSLLEEAASTKHYEQKREDTLKTIEKKDGKLREIDKILKDDIKPTLSKLKEERSSYLEYQRVIRDLEYMNKFIVAYDYTNKKAIVDNAEGELNNMKAQQKDEQNIIEKCGLEKANLESRIDELCEERDTTLSPKRDQMQSMHAELLKQDAILNNAIKRAEDDLKSANGRVKTLEKQGKEDEQVTNNVRTEISTIQNQFDDLRGRVEQSKLQFNTAQQRLQEVNSGFFISESGDATGSLAELLATAQKEQSNLEIQLNVLTMKRDHLSNVASKLQAQMRAGVKKNEQALTMECRAKELTKLVSSFELKINETGYSQDKFNQLRDDVVAVTEQLNKCNNDKHNIYRSDRRFEFNYDKPYPNFDCGKIFGLVIQLISLERSEFDVAMEIGAGGKLFNVVADEAETVAQLFDNDCLRYRTTLLPLDTIDFRPISDELITRAKKCLGNNNVWSPMELITYDKKFYRAIGYVFGNFLIARDLEMAKKVAFNRDLGVRCVTLDGEVFDPSGTLIGGNSPTDSRIFDTSKHLSIVNQTYNESITKKNTIEQHLANMDKARARFQEMHNNLQKCQMELRQIEREMMQDPILSVEKNLADNQMELDTINNERKRIDQLLTLAITKTNEAKNNFDNSESVKDRAERTAQANLKIAEEKLQKSEDNFKDIEYRYESLMLELAESEKEAKNFSATLATAISTVTTKQMELTNSKTALDEHNGVMNRFKLDFEAHKKLLKEVERQINECRDKLVDLAHNRDQATLKLDNISHRINCHMKDSEDAEKKLDKMVHKYLWIKEEAHTFNKSGGIYDFATIDVRQAQHKIDKLEDTKKKLSRKVDLRGMNMLGQTEEKYNDLMTKYTKVLEDKLTLQKVIDELDKRKDEVIKKAHEQVDRDFNKIFSTLLPGSQARLIPCEGKQLNDGLEFKIAFGSVWKESLNELSGGQRSLVALSLILALLRFKPAPLYILDEVDAALDISHTTNIGTLIKEQFNNSQFIVVSLKDGMFANANVLFKTKFVDGVSTVTRHANTARRPMTERNT